jgi:hypothetical protein
MLPQDVRIVAVVGCTKNAGKTTTLNALLARLCDASMNPGTMSIGIDGEEADFWLGVPKPSIEVRAGSWVATAEAALAAGTAGIEVVERVGGRTLLGDLIVGQVRTSGSVLLAGIRTKEDVRSASAAMLRLGACRILVDGAYQRIVAADPEVSDGVVVATGAILGTTVQEVAARTRQFLQRLQLHATVLAGDLDLMESARRAGRPAVRPDDASTPPCVVDLLESPEAIDVLGGGDAVVAFPGAVTDDLVNRCMASATGSLRVVALDPTRIFLSPSVASVFSRRHQLKVVRAIRLLCVTVNPFSVLGWTLPRVELLDAVQEVAGDIPVIAFDVDPHPS